MITREEEIEVDFALQLFNLLNELLDLIFERYGDAFIGREDREKERSNDHNHSVDDIIF